MERKIVNAEAVKTMLANLFADELQGFKLGTPEVKLLFSTAALDYVPGIVITAQKQDEVKYLIYSPLQMSINIFEEMPETPEYEIGKTYHQGVLSAEIIKENQELYIALSQDSFTKKRCKNKEQAEMLIKAFVAMSDISLQQDYFKIPGQEIVSAQIENLQYWLMPHRGNNVFLVNKNNSQVTYTTVRLQQIRIIP